MKRNEFIRWTGALIALVGAHSVSAQDAAVGPGTPDGAELIGNTVKVETNGVVNTVTFNEGGQATFVSQGGHETVGRWFVQDGKMCLGLEAKLECAPYRSAFQAGQAVSMTTDCGAALWTPLRVNTLVKPGWREKGERG